MGAWEKLYEKREKEITGQIVQNPKEVIRQMYDKLVKPQLARRGAHVPLPFEQQDAKDGAGDPTAKASSKSSKGEKKKDKKSKDKDAKRKKKVQEKKRKKEKKVKKKKKKKT